jgi:hypothetical protein
MLEGNGVLHASATEDRKKVSMTTATETDEAVLDHEVSLIRGGPFYQAQIITRLIRPHQWNLGRRIIFAVAIGWIPLVMLTAAFAPGAVGELLTDYKVSSRMLIAVPILLFGQILMESKFRTIVSTAREDLVARADMLRFDEILATVTRLRDSAVPELAIAVLVCLHIAFSFTGKISMAGDWAVDSGRLSAAGWYYVVVSQLIYQFLVGLCLWKWLLWTIFVFKFSRMRLQLLASHPDKHAGMGFFGMSTLAFAPIAFAVSAAVGATWRYEILNTDASLVSFKLPATALLVLVVLLAVGPLLFFVPKLAPLRRRGILQYGSLAHLHSAEFQDKWILHREGHELELLAAPEVTTLTDMATSFRNVEDMKAIPLDKGSLMAPVIAVVIPLLPAVMAQVPLKVVLKSLLEAMK